MVGTVNPRIEIIRQDMGRFDRRFRVGPACWPHFDLLWIHEGSVCVTLGKHATTQEMTAPSGVLIFPDVPFQGAAVGPFATASVCHFECTTDVLDHSQDQFFLTPNTRDVFHIQNLIRLSLDYKYRKAPMDIRSRLMHSILDCFTSAEQKVGKAARVENAWAFASSRLKNVRGLSDVAEGIELSESAFRALHRKHYPTSAGRHLQQMRLEQAEQLLATTGQSVTEIARAVGYAHVESFTAAFTRNKGKTPGAYRKWCRRLA